METAGGVTKTQTSKTQTSDPKKLRPPGCLENTDPEKLRPMGVAKTHTLNIFQILQLTIVRKQPLSFASTEANGFAEISPERKFALAKFRQNQILLTGCYVCRSFQIKRSGMLVIVKPVLVKELTNQRK